MGWKSTSIKPEHLQGGDWQEFTLRFPDAARFLRLCALENELRKTEMNIKNLAEIEPIDYYIERRLEIIQDLTDQAKSPDRFDHRFL